MLDGLSFKTKLLFLCLTMAMASVTIGALSYRGLNQVMESNERITEKVLPNSTLINSMQFHFMQIRLNIRSLGLIGVTKASAEAAIKRTHDEFKNYKDDHETYEKLSLLPGEKELYDDLHLKWGKYEEIALKCLGLFQTGKPEDFQTMLKVFSDEAPKVTETYNNAMLKILAFHEANMKSVTAESKATAHQVDMMIIFVSIIAVFGSMVLGYVFSTRLTKTINHIVYSLEGSAQNVSAAASQIASASEELSQASTEQAASLQETSSSVEEINSMIKSNTEYAKQSVNSSAQCLGGAEKGKSVVEQMIGAIGDINNSNNSIMEQINHSNSEMEDIVKVIVEIGNKTKVINDIVFQTKLLSFNASVEAARAGENGRGFAVVAEEIGNLASMSGSAAVEISSMLHDSVQKVEGIVKNSREKIGKLINEGKLNVDTGTRIAHDCGEVLNEIVASVANVSHSVNEIALASQEQAQGVSEITKAIAQLDAVTHENTTNSAESANSAESLSRQAGTLKELVQELVVTIDGKKTKAAVMGLPAIKTNTMATKKQAQAKPVAVVDKILNLHKKPEAANARNSDYPSSDDIRFTDV